jgi:hypothetical protein
MRLRAPSDSARRATPLATRAHNQRTAVYRAGITGRFDIL